ncbi:MAG TPA: nucleoside 2-deoxyribosyltransferase, partial [Vicinamibacterales bacterium]|nr:nucleoside 2-deoxyribosyltransferase [Vicinamibacterales bacterium]
MRIYLACTVRGDRGGVAAGRAIAERLAAHGHDVLTTHLLADNVDTAESQLTEDAVFRRDIGWLSECDVLVAEASGSSYGVGFEVGYILGRASQTGQRAVLLYD